MRRLLHPLAIGALVAVVVAALAAWVRLHPNGSLSALDVPERLLLDLRFRLRGPRPVGPEVALVVFDDKTDVEEPALFEHRRDVARVLRAIHAAGAKVIGFDGFFLAPESPIDPALARDVRAYLDRCAEGCEAGEALELLRRLRPELTGDDELIAALREAGPVVLALTVKGGMTGTGTPAGLAKGRFAQIVDGDTPPQGFQQVRASLPAFNEAALSLGFVSAQEDETSTMREVLAARALDGKAYVPFAVQLAAAFLDVPRAKLVYDGAGRTLRLGDRSVAFGPEGTLLLNHRGPEGAFPTWSAVDVVRGALPEGALQGRIAIVGVTHLGHDRIRTSFNEQVPGVEVNATLVDNILRGDPLRRSSWHWDAAACLALALLIGVAFWLLRRAAWQIGVSLALWAAYLGAGYRAFTSASLWMGWSAPSIAALLSLGGCVAVSYAREGRKRRELRGAFSHYLAEEVIHELEARDEPLRLGGERRNLTALFTDVRGFTTLSERLEPLQLVSFLNTHLSAMTRAVLTQGGLLDKYIGDALMAFFGAPVPHADHADRALAAALAMRAELDALNAGPFKPLGLTVRIGVGLNTGEMVVGNMGSDRHYNYTVAGDAVNLASRLESLTKTYGVFCLVGPGTRRAASAKFTFREVDLVQVKGKSEAVAIHELVSGPGGTLAAYAGVERFAQAMAAWRAGGFAEARRLFEEFSRDNPEDRVAHLYLERLAALGDQPPEHWSGVFVHTAK